MTKVLELALLGRLRLQQDGEPLSDLVSGKARALLCYLAVTDRPHSRQALSGLLWDEMPETDARRNLRGVLMKLRRWVAPYLIVTHQTLAFNRESAHRLDVADFRRHLAQGAPDALETAVSLYRGDFLEDFHVRQAPAFEEWVLQQRSRLREQAVMAYRTLCEHYAAQGDYERGIEHARRLLLLDPVREEGHRQLIRLLALSGQRSAALTQYEACRQILADELNVAPDEATAVLVDQIRAGEVSRETGEQSSRGRSRPTPPPPPLPSPFIAGPPITHPRQFFGRERELKRIFNLLQRPPLQNAAVIGQRRSGKTSLLHYLRTITTTPAGQLRSDQRRDWLPKPARYRWIFVDFQDPRLGTRPGLLGYLLEQMRLPIDDAGDVDLFMDRVSDALHTPTVILLDEIGVAMTRYPELDDAFWESLRSLATNQVDGNMAFVLSAPDRPAILARHSGLGSPFFNIFGYAATLGPLTGAEARALIASSPIHFPEADVDWILAQSGRWPMPLQILCRERLLSLEEGETGPDWREDARRQVDPFLPEAQPGS